MQYASTMRVFSVAVLVAAAALVGYLCGSRQVRVREVERIERRVDTVVVREPELVVVRHVERDTVLLALADDEGDSARVEVPRQQAEYAGEGYRAWVSGFRPLLDSISIERATVVKTRAPRWSVGLQAGVGLTPRGAEPYIGIGVSFTLWQSRR